MNHHCTPNVFHRFNANINRLTIHALRDIKPGEEISTSCENSVPLMEEISR